MASADDAAIANVIRNGRAATDPQNKTKKLMPPRGGNPFLGDDQIAHLVAFVKALQTTAPAAAGGVADASAAPSAQLARWVVPPAADAPSGMVSLEDRSDIGDEAAWRDRHESRRSSLVSVLTLASTGIHSLFLVGVMVVSSHVLLRGLRNESAAEESWWSWSASGWIAAAVVWLVIVLFCFVMV